MEGDYTRGPSFPPPFHLGNWPPPPHLADCNWKGASEQTQWPNSQISGVYSSNLPPRTLTTLSVFSHILARLRGCRPTYKNESNAYKMRQQHWPRHYLGEPPAGPGKLPRKILGPPLTPRRLKRIDFQPLVDKAAGKLSTWNGRNLTQAGSMSLVKSVQSSQLVYLLIVLKPMKETLDDLDKIRRRFLWAWNDAISGGKCKVN
jgi:hypothetical protein